MNSRLNYFLASGFSLSLVLICAVFWLTHDANQRYRENIASQRQHEHAARAYEAILSTMQDVESSRRGFVLTGNDDYLDPYFNALPRVREWINWLLEPLNGAYSVSQDKRVLLRTLLEERVSVARQSIEAMREEGENSPLQLMLGTQGKEIMDQIRALIAELVRHERDSADIESREVEEWATALTLWTAGGAGLSVVLLLLIFAALFREVRRRTVLEEAYHQANTDLEGHIEDLRQQRAEILLLGEMSDLLQAALNETEAYRVISSHFPQLFPQSAGGLYLTSASRNLIEGVSFWGGNGFAQAFQPEECWALRRGRLTITGQNKGPHCTHLPESSSACFVCVPMMAQGESQGVLLLRYPEGRDPDLREQEFIQACTEQVALGITNLRLRETLRNQAIRDPLTGLFNRRYMQETLERELHRAQRQTLPLGVIVTDIDHFKQFNDTFGHAAGDTVIAELGRFFQAHVRGSDVACRYGGEEFVLILPNAGMEDTVARAEVMRREAKQLILKHEERSLGAVTLSVGVAAYPEHGDSAQSLVEAADAALYRAKRNGRDQVKSAKTAVESDTPVPDTPIGI